MRALDSFRTAGNLNLTAQHSTAPGPTRPEHSWTQLWKFQILHTVSKAPHCVPRLLSVQTVLYSINLVFFVYSVTWSFLHFPTNVWCQCVQMLWCWLSEKLSEQLTCSLYLTRASEMINIVSAAKLTRAEWSGWTWRWIVWDRTGNCSWPHINPRHRNFIVVTLFFHFQTIYKQIDKMVKVKR